MAKKKTGRVKVGLVCKETGDTNYYTRVNKDNKPEKPFLKYSPKLKRRTEHKISEKLK